MRSVVHNLWRAGGSEDLSHWQMPGVYTAQVEAFLATLDPVVARRLNRH
jgi:hypothetical protein